MSAAGSDSATRAAMLCAAAMIGQQVAAKAARDALFLSRFDVAALPAMLAAAALLSLAVALLAAAALQRLGPARLVPAAFAASGALLLVEWAFVARAPGAVAVAVYLHVASLGPLVISGFWSLLGERLDARAAKRRIGWIAGAGTLGGLAGGLLAAWLSRDRGAEGLLPVLGVLHVLCAWSAGRVGATNAPRQPSEPLPLRADTLRLVREGTYLRGIATLVATSSLGATLADYLLKAQASAVHASSQELLRFFATFYTATGLLAFAVQLALGRRSLERLGPARSAAALPLLIAAGGLANLVAPGLASATALRGGEAVARASLFRLAYELLYVPLPEARKRSLKTLVDVGLDRVGDLAGAVLIQLLLWAAAGRAAFWIALATTAAGVAGLLLTGRLRRGYSNALEARLLSRAAGAETPQLAAPIVGAADALDSGLFVLTVTPPAAALAPEDRAVHGSVPRADPARDPLLARLVELRSGDAGRVRRALAAEPLDELLVAQAIRLLAWDDVREAATSALRGVAARAAGQLVDALLDVGQEFAIRRRVPRVLEAAAAARATEGLLEGLEDARFEVRFACARALSVARARAPAAEFPGQRVIAAVLREAAPERRALWETHRLLDAPDGAGETSLCSGLARVRGGRGLEHVFTLLSLVLPADAVRVAYRALQTQDEVLRGTALEYLDSVLPRAARAALLPILEAEAARSEPRRTRGDALGELMRSESTVELRLGELCS